MRRRILVLLVFFCLASLVSCASKVVPDEEEIEVIEATVIDAPDVETKTDHISLEGNFENDNYRIAVITDGTNSDSYFRVTISNKTMEILSVDGNKIVYSNGVKSTRLVDGTTRKINSNLAQADVVVAPKSITTVNLFTADESFISTAFEGSLYFRIDVGSGFRTIGVDLKKEGL